MTDPASPTDDTEEADDDRTDGELDAEDAGQEPVTVAPDEADDAAAGDEDGDDAASDAAEEPETGDDGTEVETDDETTDSVAEPTTDEEQPVGRTDDGDSPTTAAERDDAQNADGDEGPTDDDGVTGEADEEADDADDLTADEDGDHAEQDETGDSEQPTADEDSGDGETVEDDEATVEPDDEATAEDGEGATTGDEEPAGEDAVESPGDTDAGGAPGPGLPPDVRKYDRFKKMDGAQYERVNEFLRDRTYITAREWAIARLCADFRTETGVEMTKIGEHLPYLVPFMTDTYTPQAVNQARHAFEQKVRKAGATFLYGAMCDFFTADELDDLMYEVTEVAKFLLEVEGVDLTVEEELAAEERISSVMREVRQSSDELRHEGVCCPECGHEFDAEGHEVEATGDEAEATSESD